MKALVKKYPQKGLWLEEVPEPATGPNDVKIKIQKTAICGTDLHIYNWDEWSQKTIQTPLVIGHEYVGQIVEVGANVQNWKVGQIVSGEGHIVCGKCRNCLAGNGHLCKQTVGVGVNRDGAFAQYLVIPQENVRRCEENIDPELYSIFDPFGNAVHTALSFELTGEDVLITGAGPIGIMAAGICKYAGARRVVITDLNDYRLDLARKMGVDAAVNTGREDLNEVMKQLNIVEGFDVGLEMSGNGHAFNQMLSVMRTGGKISLLGLGNKPISVDMNYIIGKGLTLQGIYGRKMDNWHQMAYMVQGGLDMTPIITHRFHYTDFQKGFDAMMSGNSGKVILDWTTKK